MKGNGTIQLPEQVFQYFEVKIDFLELPSSLKFPEKQSGHHTIYFHFLVFTDYFSSDVGLRRDGQETVRRPEGDRSVTF